MHTSFSDIRQQILDVIIIATGRVVSEADLEASAGNLHEAGVNSIGIINILEALESRYGILINEEDDLAFLENVDDIAQFVLKDQGAKA